MAKKGGTFKPAGKIVMVEPVPKESKIRIIIPDSAKQSGTEVDVVVRAIGDGVTRFAVGDKVVCALPTKEKMMKFDNGDGMKLYCFYDEDQIFGKFVEAAAE